MPRTHAAYPPEYRQRIIELVRAGREQRLCRPTATRVGEKMA
jgi:hypothetical protein